MLSISIMRSHPGFKDNNSIGDSSLKVVNRLASRYRLLCQACLSLSVSYSLLLGSLPCAIAQITSDRSLPTTVSSPDSLNFTIGSGTQSGTNLYHSFSQFSVPTDGSAFFSNALDVETIFARVTGGDISNIDGLIQANGTADLFLVNPSGVVFGPSAQLHLGGAFIGTTAESIHFADGSEFGVADTNTLPQLTVSTPIGLQMGTTSKDIQVNNIGHSLNAVSRAPIVMGATPRGLQVNANNTLIIVGRAVSLDGGILSVAGDGRTHLGAVSAPILVELIAPTSDRQSWHLDYSGVSQLGNITLSGQSLINAGNTGSIEIQGHNISIQDGSVIFQENTTSQAAGHLSLRAINTLDIQGESLNGLRSGVISDNRNDGQGGDILLSASQIIGSNNGMGLRSFTFGAGRGGDITIDATTLDMIGGANNLALVELITMGAGNSGTLTVDTTTLHMQGAALVNNVSGGTGNAGSIIIDASESVVMEFNNFGSAAVITSSALSANGNAGNTTITTPTLALQDGSLISSSTFGAGNAGTITINASDKITISGEGYFAGTNTVEATRIQTAGDLLPRPARAFRRLPDTITGSSGDIVLNTGALFLDGGQVSVSHDSVGDGGILEVNARQVTLKDEGSLLASTQSGNGGNIQLNVDELLFMRSEALVNAESLGTGNGGNITIDTPVIFGLDDSDIVANAVIGNGGNINIITQGLFGLAFRNALTLESDITASSQFGINGTVSINDVMTEPSANFIKLPEAPTDIDEQIVAACAAGEGNRFIVSGRGGLASSPIDTVLNLGPWVDVRNISTFDAQESVPRGSNSMSFNRAEASNHALMEASEWQVNDRGQIELLTASVGTRLSSELMLCLSRQAR
ncbi:MAG: filamentous hemagglutinin N-terminal domain-containing protein [Cyanobacteria bacterium P01_F01_bin.53]